MAVVKRVCKESMLAAQEEIKNTPGYHRNGEVAMLRNIIVYLCCQCKLQSIALLKYSNYMVGFFVAAFICLAIRSALCCNYTFDSLS